MGERLRDELIDATIDWFYSASQHHTYTLLQSITISPTPPDPPTPPAAHLFLYPVSTVQRRSCTGTK